MKKIAIVGAGMAGLASCQHLYKKFDVTLFDTKGIGAGASGVAAGLLHPFVGGKSKLNWRGFEGLESTLKLIDKVQQAVDEPIILQRGFKRVAVNEEMEVNFRRLSQEQEKVHWLGDGIFIEEGYVIDTPLYLKALTDALKGQISYIKRQISSLEELCSYDHIILTTGAWTRSIRECKDLPLTRNKGHLLVMDYPLKETLNGRAYLVPTRQGLIVGSSFEKDFETEEPDIERAKLEILPKAIEIIPELEQAPILDCRASLRAVAKGHLPLLTKLNDKTTLLTGLGSKGLLYHALLAKQIEIT